MDDMEDMEERTSAIIECPHCHVKVLPTSNNICPACRKDIASPEGVDPDEVSLTIHEAEELPPLCYSCNQYTDRTIRVSGDKESELGSFFSPTDVGTSNVVIFLPQCEGCGDEFGEPELVNVDYEYQKMTLVVHRGFRERVFELREARSQMGDVKNGDEA
jgi:hypothetical protein